MVGDAYTLNRPPQTRNSFKVAIDASNRKASQPDVVRLDLTGGGNFTDALVLELNTHSNLQGNDATFGPTIVPLQHGRDVIPVLVEGLYHKSGEYRHFWVRVLAAVQGKVQFGDKTHAVRLTDCNGNFNFSDAPLITGKEGEYSNLAMGDHLMVDQADDDFQKPLTVAVGQPVRVDGKWYKIEYDPNQKQISAQPIDLPSADDPAGSAAMDLQTGQSRSLADRARRARTHRSPRRRIFSDRLQHRAGVDHQHRQ
jgi:hypothetical protein